MPAVDAAWLRMDSPTNAMVITAMMILEPAPSFASIVALVEERLLRHERFRQRVVEPTLGLPHWELDPSFDVGDHVHQRTLPEPRDQAALERLVGELASAPLDRSKPLWQLYLIEGAPGGGALVARLHHSMGDGVALVRFLLGLTDEGRGLEGPEIGVSPPHAHGVLEHAKVAAAQATTLGRLLFLPSDPPSALKGDLGTRKRTAWSAPEPLDDVSDLAHRVGGKVNDVLMGALTGALASFLRTHGSDPGEIRALVPMYVKQEDAGHELGNHFGLVYVALPLGVADPVERIRELKRRVDLIKSQPDAIVAMGVLSAMGVATRELEHIGIELFTMKATVMITNVPGPPAPMHLTGSVVTDLMVWAPVSGRISIGLSFLSYAGRIRLGVVADAGLVRDATEITSAFTSELEAARRAIRATGEGR